VKSPHSEGVPEAMTPTALRQVREQNRGKPPVEGQYIHYYGTEENDLPEWTQDRPDMSGQAQPGRKSANVDGFKTKMAKSQSVPTRKETMAIDWIRIRTCGSTWIFIHD